MSTDQNGTSVADVYAAADIAEPVQQVVIAVAASTTAALSIVHEFVADTMSGV